MSGGSGCRCPAGPTKRSGWRVYTWRANYSAFSGNRRTPSDYSALGCDNCGARWRTKAAYVDTLPIAPGA